MLNSIKTEDQRMTVEIGMDCMKDTAARTQSYYEKLKKA